MEQVCVRAIDAAFDHGLPSLHADAKMGTIETSIAPPLSLLRSTQVPTMDCSCRVRLLSSVACLVAMLASFHTDAADQLEPISYNNPGLVVDLGVGLWAWPLPMDYDQDGDLDLVVSCPDKPYNGVYFFENPGTAADGSAVVTDELPVFKPAVRLGPAVRNIQISYVDDDVRLLEPGYEYRNFREQTWGEKVKLPVPPKLNTPFKRTRANQWKSVDYDGDGDEDLIVGLGVWDDYGWDDAWNDKGEWTNGPLHGYVYLVENVGRIANPSKEDASTDTDGLTIRPTETYADPVQLATSDGQPIDVYGMPSPNLADFDGDGDLDLICGEFLDGFTYFENSGSRSKPSFAAGRQVTDADAQEVRMDLQMITPVAIDWDRDGDTDLICGDEDGRVAFIENVGRTSKSVHKKGESERTDLEVRPTEGVPVFRQPVYFRQQAAEVKFGALVTPVSVDWDGDGDEDLVCGNTAGYLGLIENLDAGRFPKFSAPKDFFDVSGDCTSDDAVIWRVRHQAEENGSIQGPCEAKWGYTSPAVSDWDGDGRLDVVVNDIWGKPVVYFGFDISEWSESKAAFQALRKRQTHNPLLGNASRFFSGPYGADAQGIIAPTEAKPSWVWWTADWTRHLVTQWRTTPCVIDWNDDGFCDLVMLDHEGYLAFYERARRAGDTSRRAGDVSPLIGAGQRGAGKSTQADQGADAPRSPGELELLPPRSRVQD